MVRMLAIALLVLGGCDRVLQLGHVDPRGDAGSAGPDADTGGIMLRQSTGQANNTVVAITTSISVTLDQPVEAGDVVVAAFVAWNGGLTTISDDANTVYARVPINVTSMNNNHMFIEVGKITASPPDGQLTVTVECSADSGQTMLETSLIVHDYVGLSGSTLTESHAQQVGTSQTPSCGQVMTSFPPEVVFAVNTHDANATTTAGDGFVLGPVAADDTCITAPLASEDLIVPVGAGTTMLTPGFNLSNASAWACAAIVLR